MKLLFLENGIVGYNYVEPYAGGASVALALLFEEYASHIHINDLNRSVHAFWQATLTQPDELCSRIKNTPVTIEQWNHERAVQVDPDADPLDLGFSTFFLNRTNRSGIIEGGIIGGCNQTGTWKLDARYNKADLIQRISKIARYSSRITLTNIDAARYLREQVPVLPVETFIYLDPPYYVKGEGLYEHFYTDENHREIADVVRTLRGPWLVSYDAAPQICALYEMYESIHYGLKYSAADRYQGSECMMFSPGLHRPKIDSPANVPISRVDKEKLKVITGQNV